MRTQEIPKKILAPTGIRPWRDSVAQAGGTVAVVAGSFDIFQPGNLLAVRTAARQASHVCVVIDSNEHREHRGWTWNPADTRMESASFLRDVSVVTRSPAEGLNHGFQQLAPYTFVDCAAQSVSDPLRRAARPLAETCVDIPAVPGCFTPDISDRILHAHTPVPVDPGVCAPLPDPADLDRLLQHRKGQTLVTVNGCFDILHLGHLRMLAKARQMGDALIVLVNDDASVHTYKGPARPIFPVHFRVTALQALTSVSLAYPFSGDNPLSLLAKIRPEIHVKGGTYEEERVRQERDLLERWGGRVEFYPLVEGYSTTELLNRTRK